MLLITLGQKHHPNPDKSPGLLGETPHRAGGGGPGAVCVLKLLPPLSLACHPVQHCRASVLGFSRSPLGGPDISYPFPGGSDFTLELLVSGFSSMEDRDSWECGSHPVWVFP